MVALKSSIYIFSFYLFRRKKWQKKKEEQKENENWIDAIWVLMLLSSLFWEPSKEPKVINIYMGDE